MTLEEFCEMNHIAVTEDVRDVWAGAVGEGIRRERERCVESLKALCATLSASVDDHAKRGDPGTALRLAVELDGVLLAIAAIREGK